jgi:hypothetical protein
MTAAPKNYLTLHLINEPLKEIFDCERNIYGTIQNDESEERKLKRYFRDMNEIKIGRESC